MANYQTSFSVQFHVGAGNVEAALAIYKQMEAERDDADEAIGFEAERDSPDDDATLWLHDGYGDGDVEAVIAFALKCAEALNLTGRWGFCWSLSASRPLLDAFGGGAQLLDLGRRESLDWVDCAHWLATRIGAGEHHVVPTKTILQPVAAARGWSEATQAGVLLDFLDLLIKTDPDIADQLRFRLVDAIAAATPLEAGTLPHNRIEQGERAP